VDRENGQKTFFITQKSVNHSLKNRIIRKVVSEVIVNVKNWVIFGKYEIGKIDLLKIDIEGSEFDLFDSDQFEYI
jgi:hypothetical protein